MKILDTMAQKTQFEVKVPGRETRDLEKFKAYNPSFSEKNFTLISDYHLTCGKIRRKIVPSQGFN